MYSSAKAHIAIASVIALLCSSCNGPKSNTQNNTETIKCINPHAEARFASNKTITNDVSFEKRTTSNQTSFIIDTSSWPPKPWPQNMVWIPAGTYLMGGIGKLARSDEFPVHQVKVDGFWMDKTELTIGDFKKFIHATGYITTAEQKPQWKQLKTQLPPHTPKPDDSLLVAGSLVFTPTDGPVSLNDYTQWWAYVKGANWRHPMGAQTDVIATDQFDDYPVTQVSWFDAIAYCKWAGKRLPTEAEWEWAAKGGLVGKEFSWGDKAPSAHNIRANLWQGDFPYRNNKADGYEYCAPVKSYEPSKYGLYDIIGDVWEWCSDWYRSDTYEKDNSKGVTANPIGPIDSFDPDEPYTHKKVVRGGSYLCNEQYCASYRPAARMKTDPYSGESHTGFRAVMSQQQWAKLCRK